MQTSFDQLQVQLYTFVGDMFMNDTVESVAKSYDLDEGLEWDEVMDQIVSIEMNSYFH